MDYCEILIFSLNGKDYAVELGFVERIMGQMLIESVPETEEFIEGIIDYEGGTLTILNLLAVFGQSYSKAFDDESRIVVLTDSVEKIGIKVDAVKGVRQFKKTDIENLPRIIASNEETKVKGLIKSDGVIKVLLNAQRFLNF
ncbi:MAG: chemotaxis protein CheW [Sarcina sp.]